MDILDRFINFDDWANRRVLQICDDLSTDQLNYKFDIGHETIINTLSHMTWNIEVWTFLMTGGDNPVRRDTGTMESIQQHYWDVSVRFAAAALKLAAENRLDQTYVDILDNPPTQKSFGGTITHVLTHNMVHRSEILHILKRLGVEDIIEGDVLSWEAGKC